MRLSDIKGERAIEVIGELIDPIANIAENKEATALFRREKLPEGIDAKAFVVSRLRKGLPVLLKNHKGDIVSILAALEGVTPAEYAATLDLRKVVKDLTELLTDEEFMAFFTSEQSEKSSGSVTANSEDSL
jgi:hypothetical protein